MPEKVSRRTFLKKFLGTTLTVTGAAAGGYTYAAKIEPRRLKVNSYEITHQAIPNSFHQFKMVQFSDTHLGFQYTLEQLAQLIEKINGLKPDILFFTGDLLDAPNQYLHSSKVIELLKQFTAPSGKFAVYGNHDHGGYGTDIYREIMEASGFKILQNESTPLSGVAGEKIYLLGIDDAMLGRPDIYGAMIDVPKDSYKILLSHAPDLADFAIEHGIQLQLSGHSHGGQIQLPFLGALVKPPFAEKYYEGFYKIGETSPLTLYVNRGLGTTRLPFRFLSVPEIAVFTLKKATDS